MKSELGVSVTKSLLIILVTVFCYSSGVAQPTLVIENGRVIIGNGTILEQASVVVSGDSIYSVTQERVEAPDAHHIDASGKTILPGLIDAHVHLTVSPAGLDSMSMIRHLQNEVPSILESFLEGGVTTVRATGDYWPWIGNLRDSLATNALPGPRIVAAGPVFTVEGAPPAIGACGEIHFCRSHLAQVVTGPNDAQQAVQRLGAEGVDYIKLLSDTRFTPVRIDPEIVAAIVDQAHREGLRAVGHVIGSEYMMQYADMGIDGFVHPPTIKGRSPLPEDQVRDLAVTVAKYKTPVTSTLAVSLFDTEKPIDNVLAGESSLKDEITSRARNVALLAEDGVPIVLGSDWRPFSQLSKNVQPGMATITEMKMLQWGGLSREAIIEAATANAAQALEMGDQVGTLEAGKLADLIVVDGNPLEDLWVFENVEIVVQGGEIVKPNFEY